MHQDAEAFRAIEHQPWENIHKVGLGESCFKLRQRVRSCSLWGNGTKSHPFVICKPCLDSSLELVSLLLICSSAVWEVDMCMAHIQASTNGTKVQSPKFHSED